MSRTLSFAQAIEEVLGQAMAADTSIVVFGEDIPLIRRNLLARFGNQRVRGAPISESAFLGAAVGAAMTGLRPVVEIMLIDFIGVCTDALLNHAAKLEAFSGGGWKAPMVVRAACGGGYGDGGQHEQTLWGWLAHIPGLSVVVPSTPADAGGLMLAALEHDGPVIYLEHKLLSDYWLDWMGSGGRENVFFDVPDEGASGPVPDTWEAVPLGRAVRRREGSDLSMISVGVSVHRCLEAAASLESQGVAAEVIDLRSVSPLDRETVIEAAARTGRLLMVDEDYRDFGLSGEVAATIMESGQTCRFERVCTESTVPFNRSQEDQTLPNVERILDAATRLLGD